MNEQNKKSYADICKERAEKFPFGSSNYGHDTMAEAFAALNELDYAYSEMVPELARRLKRACDALREMREMTLLGEYPVAPVYLELADELEAPLSQKEDK